MSTTLLPPLRRRLSNEVIDVDLLGDDEISRPPSRRRRIDTDSWVAQGSSSGSGGRGAGAGSSREVIIIDSDEEDIVQRPSVSSRSRRHFSPPPPPARSSIPPVPRIPSFAPHRRDVILPDANAFLRDLDSRLSDPAAARSSRNATASSSTRAAPHSHHTPVMGLGGALLARISNDDRIRRQQERIAREARRRQQDERMFRGLGLHQPLGAWGADGNPFGNDLFEDGAHDGDMYTSLGFLANAFRGWDGPDNWGFGHPWNRAPRVPQRPTYKVAYTHVEERPTPGFTYDFDPSEKEREAIRRRKVAAGALVLDELGEIEIEEAPSSSAASTGLGADEPSSSLLICAHCGDPLLLSGDGESRLWALRCGHMLDGKCVEALMRPPVPVVLQLAPEPAPEPVFDDEPKDVQPARTRSKGKGRGRGRDKGKSKSKGRAPARGDAGPAAPTEEGPGSGSQPVTAHSIARAGSRRGILKGKSRVNDPVLLAEHSWECPVVGCRKIHVSEQLEGGDGHEGEVRWVHRQGQGAVQVFA